MSYSLSNENSVLMMRSSVCFVAMEAAELTAWPWLTCIYLCTNIKWPIQKDTEIQNTDRGTEQTARVSYPDIHVLQPKASSIILPVTYTWTA